MKKEIYLAAATGDLEFLKAARAKDEEAVVAKYSDEDLMGVTGLGDNIIHVAAEHGHLDFIKTALQGFDETQQRKLICATNNDGDTPLHLAAKQDTSEVAEHLVDHVAVAPCSDPLRSKNKKGNTPLHVALINGGKSIRVASYLVGAVPEVASYANHRQQTPLHLAVSYNNQDAKRSMTNMVNKLNSLGASLDYTKSLFEEDSLSFINQLLDVDPTICWLKDDHGLTPLLKAAQKSYISAVKEILKCCPECAKICDSTGKTVLHHIKLPTSSEATEFLKSPAISALMDQQDVYGNTPLHMAIMNCDYNMVKAMIECNANFAIQNDEGTSPVTLIQSNDSSATLIQSNTSSFLNKMKEDIRRSNIMMKDELMMPKDLFEAASKGNGEYLLERLRDPQQFQSRLTDGTNILHVAFQCHYVSNMEEFVKEAVKKLPMMMLLCQTDFKGCTPIHYLLTSRYRLDKTIIDSLKGVMKEIKEEASCYPLPPWEAKDFNGDTLLHLALKHDHLIHDGMAKLLIEEIVDAKSLRETNNSNETPLHVLCRHDHWWNDDYLVELLIEKDMSVVHMYDADGFTPFLRAAKSNRLHIASKILEKCPETIIQVDFQFGRNLLHFLPDLNPDVEFYRDSIQKQQFQGLMRQGDREGNTPLHLAILQRRFVTAQLFIQKDVYLLFNRVNNDGNSPYDLLRTTEDIPRKFKKFLIWIDRIEDREDQLRFFKESLYGVYYSDMKDFMGTLGVVAALLATITFTAAFTVPGGYDQDKGFPILAKQVAFQVFMVTDVIAMCSSVLALCCLIWFYTSNRTEDEGTRLGDLSMAFLQLSFYATLVAFMTGVYVTTSSKALWLAIFTCVTCSLVLLMMRKHFIMKYLGNVLYYIHDRVKKMTREIRA